MLKTLSVFITDVDPREQAPSVQDLSMVLYRWRDAAALLWKSPDGWLPVSTIPSEWDAQPTPGPAPMPQAPVIKPAVDTVALLRALADLSSRCLALEQRCAELERKSGVTPVTVIPRTVQIPPVEQHRPFAGTVIIRSE